jgi:hypothetical protein
MAEPKNEFEAKKNDILNEATEQTKLDKFRANIALLRDAVMPSLSKMDLIRQEAKKLKLVLDKGAFEGETALDAAIADKQKEEDAVEASKTPAERTGMTAAQEEAAIKKMYSQPEPGLHDDLPPNVTDN